MKKPSLALMDDFDELPSQQVKLLTTEPEAVDPANEKKPRPSSVVMLGVRVTKAERRDYKKLAADLDMTLEQLVRAAVKGFKESKGLR